MAKTFVIAYVDDSGNLLTGKSPKISIINVNDGTVLVDADDMEELSLGWYKYDYDDFDPSIPIVATCDLNESVEYRYGFAVSGLEIEDKVDFLVNMTGGRWKLQSPDTLIFYEDDNVTEVARFKCYNGSGQPAIEDIVDCRRV